MGSRSLENPPAGSTDSVMDLPEMMFADGEEPVGVRVITYQSSRSMNTILAALEDDEIQFLRSTCFGKLMEIADKPAFSGRFARYMLSRQLKVDKKHEAWFRFAGKPIRFSLREFAIVTGLPCGEFPPKSKLKKKRTLRDKPYWPELFGSVEDLSVSRTVKLLRKNYFTDKDLRIKLACLAIVSSVLMSTNLKMKMIKEYAELLTDLDAFFAYPWGRVAFDMLMSSIKKRDEVSLSQETIALKGLALALQLVIVEAVPSLTEVVQEACTSSDSDSDNEENESMVFKQKRQTLNPSHAREVDKKSEVVVRSIIPFDTSRPLVESDFKWDDEVFDVKVENLLNLISRNHEFTREMFRGGATKLDVQRMREKQKAQGRKKRVSNKDTSSIVVDESRIQAIVSAQLKLELEMVDRNMSSALESVRDVTSSALTYKASVVSSVEDRLQKFKQEILTLVRNANTQAAVAPPPINNLHGTSCECQMGGNTQQNGVVNGNDAIIVNVLDNISHYSTPPGPGDRSPISEGRSRNVRRALTSPPRMNDDNQVVSAFSANSKTNDQADPTGTPTFCLGLLEDKPLHPEEAADEMGDNGDVGIVDPLVEPMTRRTSKRLRLVTSQLITDFECETAILNRTRQNKLMGSNYYELPVIREKYAKLTDILKKPCVVNVGGLSVTGKDITLIAERSRHVTPKVFDILMHLMRSTCYSHVACSGPSKPEFLDTTFVAMLCRNYEKFEKSNKQDSYIFPKGLVDRVVNCCSSGNAATRFYLPLHLDKLWIGLCVDFTDCKIYVFDCNPTVRSDSEWRRDLLPFSDMFPYLLKSCGLLEGHPNIPIVPERVKVVAQNNHSPDSALTAALLMQTHALFGVQTCRCITPAIIMDEAHRAAVMLYEFYEKL